jgi:SAM-dependent methyltransferase
VIEHPTTTANMTPPTDANRTFARNLAADSIANGDATGWFETLYAAAEQGTVTVPWADFAPSPRLVSALAGLAGGGRALVIGCGLGDDAEHVASLGYTTVAFDVSPTAVVSARRRFPRSSVEYVIADLLSPPQSWAGAFELVVEVYTLQVLTGAARRAAFARTAELLAPGGRLLVIAAARAEHDDPEDALATHPSRDRVLSRVRAAKTPLWTSSTTRVGSRSAAGEPGSPPQHGRSSRKVSPV